MGKIGNIIICNKSIKLCCYMYVIKALFQLQYANTVSIVHIKIVLVL